MSANAVGESMATPAFRRVYISDLHLETHQDARFARFREWLRHESRWADEIFILGDLFEAWVGDDDDSELAEQACAALREAAARIPVLAMAGNRDFLRGAGFAARTCATLIDDPFQTEDGLLLTHGDTLCTDDRVYAEFRATVRSAAWRENMLAKPLEARRRIGAEMRAASAASKANRAENIMDVNQAAVGHLSREHRAATLIHGHTHRPGIHRSAGLTRYVLGNWDRCGWMLRQQGHRFDLECFSLAVPYRTSRPES